MLKRPFNGSPGWLVIHASGARLAAYHAGEISFAELDTGIQGWIAHVGHADSRELRRHVLDSLVIRPAEHRRAVAVRHTRYG